MVKTPPSNLEGMGLLPSQLRSRSQQQQQQKYKQQKKYCNKFNTLKMVHIKKNLKIYIKKNKNTLKTCMFCCNVIKNLRLKSFCWTLGLFLDISQPVASDQGIQVLCFWQILCNQTFPGIIRLLLSNLFNHQVLLRSPLIKGEISQE